MIFVGERVYCVLFIQLEVDPACASFSGFLSDCVGLSSL